MARYERDVHHDELDEIESLARPLEAATDLDPLLDHLGDAREVLLGEASHGTAEFYRWRAEITRRLIVERGFSFVAVEGDWPDCFAVNRWVKGRVDQERGAPEVLGRFDRWPAWMWANEEVALFVEWLRDHNARTSADVGFFGLDVHSLWESLDRILRYLADNEAHALEAARAAARCFDPYCEDPQRYAWATRLVPKSCESEVIGLLSELRRALLVVEGDPEADLDVLQNA